VSIRTKGDEGRVVSGCVVSGCVVSGYAVSGRVVSVSMRTKGDEGPSVVGNAAGANAGTDGCISILGALVRNEGVLLLRGGSRNDSVEA
jgi:hypothetical protein